MFFVLWQIASATHSSAWLSEVQFRKADASSSKSAINIKDKYTLLRPDGHQTNGVVKSAISANKSISSMCRSDSPHVNGIVANGVASDEVSTPKIQIDSSDTVSLDWQKVSHILSESVSNACLTDECDRSRTGKFGKHVFHEFGSAVPYILSASRKLPDEQEK